MRLISIVVRQKNLKSTFSACNAKPFLFYLIPKYFSRLMKGQDGILFYDYLKEIRDILGFNNAFSIMLDIEKDKKKRRTMYEEQFLQRLRR